MERRLSLTPNGNARFHRVNLLSEPCLSSAAVGREVPVLITIANRINSQSLWDGSVLVAD